jgi:hypothetical protein
MPMALTLLREKEKKRRREEKETAEPRWALSGFGLQNR